MAPLTSYLKSGVAVLSTFLAASVSAQSNTRVLGTVPAGVPIEVVNFGERPSWSRDGLRLAFMSYSYGDAYEVDLTTKQLTLLTGFPNAGFLRAQYLANGDLFLIGNRYFDDTFDVLGTRVANQEMWVLPKGGSAAIPLNNSIYEGVAISTRSNLIAFAENFQSTPENFAFNESAIYTAEIVYDDVGNPSLANKRELRRAMSPECTLEPQDFRANDTELVYNCYPQFVAGYGSDIYKIDLETLESESVRTLYPDEFNESEGIFPDGEYILVESSRDNPDTGDGSQHLIDIWKLKLEPPYDDLVRLTYLTNEEGTKAGNPVVSPDGKTIAFAIGRVGTQAGQGFGIMIMGV
jgi:Tol biopolymer transport system component